MPHGLGERHTEALAGASSGQVDRVRHQGHHAFALHDNAIDVADLVFDSIVDAPVKDGPVRYLRFACRSTTIEVDVAAETRSRVDVRVRPTADSVEVRTMGEEDGAAFFWEPGDTLPSCPTLTSLIVRWEDSTLRAIRTAWVLL